MKNTSSPLAHEKIGKLLYAYALPSAVSGLVGAAYNIVDQIFIGHQVGSLGNAATNVVFPLVTLANAIALMAGVGSSSGFSRYLGEQKKEDAGKMIGHGLSMLIIAGIAMTLIVQLFLEPILHLCGATANTLPLAMTYERITAWGIFFFLISTGASALIRADGSPKFALASVIAGAILNVFLDAFFMVYLDWGIAGAALATLIGQVVSGLMVIYYFICRFQSVPLKISYLIPDFGQWFTVLKLGFGPFLNHVSLMVVQLMLNNALVKWGALSSYGKDIPMACAGIVTKVSSITNAIVIGIAQGSLPIIGYNYGAKNYKRVRETGLLTIKVVLIFSFVVFACFQLFPRQITMLFGTGSEEYYAFAEQYFRIFMMLICVSGLQITVANFFTALGKPMLSILISASRQIVAFPILLTVLPHFFGINGVLASGPIADGVCAVTATVLFYGEYRRLKQIQM